VSAPSPLAPTATAECDELSALFAFLAGRAGVRSIGLLWPYPNHTVAVWTVGSVRVVIPTTQIFLEESDYWGTKKFDPWRQKAIYEYIRRDVPDSFDCLRILKTRSRPEGGCRLIARPTQHNIRTAVDLVARRAVCFFDRGASRRLSRRLCLALVCLRIARTFLLREGGLWSRRSLIM